MAGAKVVYPAVQGLMGASIAFTFVLSREGGYKINVDAPIGYQLYCSPMASTGLHSLRQISLPGALPGCTDDPLTLTLTEIAPAAKYSFIIGADIPYETPDPNFFNIIIRNKQNQVIDAAYQLLGQTLQNIPVKLPTLNWQGAPVQGKRTYVHVGLTFARVTPFVKSILFTLPKGLVHDVQSPTDVKNLNKAFPVASSSSWAETSNPTYLKVLVDDTVADREIPAGQYKFEFPILLPADIPPENLWYISLCSSRVCYDIEEDKEMIIATFVRAGFEAGEVSPFSMRPSAAVPGHDNRNLLVSASLVSLALTWAATFLIIGV
jgi:hypothetical protein